MAPVPNRFPLVGLLLVMSLGMLPSSLHAQLTPAQEKAGFVAMVEGEATGRELTQQSELWVLEVRFKPMRLIWVDTTDPETGKKKREMVWYLVYQAVNRPQNGRVDDSDLQPVNVQDPPPGVPYFIPEFTLVTTDEDGRDVHHDVIFPEAQAAIIAREKTPLKNTVDIVGPIPPAVPQGSAETEADRLNGVAIFRGMDPATDFFRVLMGGFSNGYRIVTGPDGEPLTTRKSILQKYERPGDEYLQDEKEFKLDGDPAWIYLPAPSQPDGIPAGALQDLPQEGQSEETGPATP